MGRARLGLPWPDLAEIFAHPQAPVGGFEYLVDLATLPPVGDSVSVRLVAGVVGGAPEVVVEREIPLVGPDARPEPRAEREAELDRRRAELVAFTHRLDYGGAQLWLHEVLVRSGAGRRYPCRVMSLHDGPLRHELERRGVEVHVTGAVPVGDAEEYAGRLTELAPPGGRRRPPGGAGQHHGRPRRRRCGHPSGPAHGVGHPREPHPRAYFTAALGRPASPEVDTSVRRALATCGALVFEAEATRRLYLPWAGDGAVVVPYGVDVDAIDAYRSRVSRKQARRTVGLDDDARVLLVMGTTEPRKSQTLVAQAFAQLTDISGDWVLVFVGGIGSPYADGLRVVVVRSGVGPRVRILPVVADTYRWYRAADALVSASDLESLPRSALEAMAFGLPVVSTAVFGVPELIEHGRTGILFEPNDLGAATAALRTVVGLDVGELATVGEAARMAALAEHHSSGYVDDIGALLRGLAAHPGRRPGDILATDGRRAPGARCPPATAAVPPPTRPAG